MDHFNEFENLKSSVAKITKLKKKRTFILSCVLSILALLFIASLSYSFPLATMIIIGIFGGVGLFVSSLIVATWFTNLN